MYKIIGGDGREYGPVAEQTLREWIRGGRANTQTKVEVDGNGLWQALGSLPEFGDLFGMFTPPPLAAPDETIVNSHDYNLDIFDCLSRSWESLKKNFGMALVGWLLVVILEVGISRIPHVGQIINFVLGGVFSGGVMYFFLKQIRGERVKITDAFSGFTLAFLPLVLAGLVTSLLTVAGLFLLILPGIYLAVAWSFTHLLIIDRKMGFWAAMELSRKAVSKHWWTIFFSLLIVAIVMVLGLLALGIGVLVTMPLGLGALAAAYEVIFPRVQTPSTPVETAPSVEPQGPA